MIGTENPKNITRKLLMLQNPNVENEQPTSIDDLLERHEQAHHDFKKLSSPEQARFQVRMRDIYANDLWLFLENCVYTQDQVDTERPIKPYPSDLRYLQFLSEAWKHKKLLAIPKSRRMICSWSFIASYLHDTAFNEGRFNAFVSKKEDDASELVARAEFIYNKIPEWRIPKALLPSIRNGKMSKQPPTLEFEDIHSKIQGFPQGADQLRQFTLSGVLGDECAFWEDAQKFYSATKPTTDGGGRITLISSRSPGFFKKIVFDQLNAQDLSFQETPPAPVQKPLEGIEMWTNPKNKFTVIDLHYTANPGKRGDAWREGVRASMPIRDFLMEYEKSWQTYEGKPVYEDFSKPLHTTQEALEPEPGIPLILGVDFGLTPAIVLAQLVGNQLRILEEFIEKNGSISKLGPRVWKHLAVNYEPWTREGGPDINVYIDPAGFQRAQTDEKTCAKCLRESGFTKILPGPVDWEARKQAVEYFLIRVHKGKPAIIICEPNAPLLCEGFNGGYQYPEKTLEVEPAQARPIKNKFSHPHDGLQYLCHGALALAKKYNLEIATPTYGFQKRIGESNGRAG